MNMQIDRHTLILIPCCAAKESQGGALAAPADPLAGMVAPPVYAQVLAARRSAYDALMRDMSLQEGTFAKNRLLQGSADMGGLAFTARYLPAVDRYTGILYSVPGARSAVHALAGRAEAPHLLILSALYGPLHPLSPIQDYNLRMDQAPARIWRQAFPAFLEHYVRAHAIRRMVLLVGFSTNYFKVASAAAVPLLQQGLLEDVVQYHVIDGSTRVTPREHGHILQGMLTGRRYDSALLEPRWLDGRPWRSTDGGPQRIGISAPHPRTVVPVTAAPGRSSNPSGMRRAPPPNQTLVNAPQRTSADPTLMEPTSIEPTSIEPPPSHAGNGAAPSGPIRAAFHAAPLLTAPAASPARQMPSVNTAPTHGETPAHGTRFYELLHQLSTGADQGLPLSELIDKGKLPERGVYFFMDAGASKDATTWRVCRVGTHAVSAGSKSTLRTRLRTHLGSRNGNGNHRGSIFRLHVGTAMLRRAGSVLQTWGVGSVAPAALRASDTLRSAEAALEQDVSKYIGALRVLWVDVPDAAGPDSMRSTIEKNAIAMLSGPQQPGPPPAADWLGHTSTRKEIVSSKLWNVNYVNDSYDPEFIAVFERAVALTLSAR